MIPSDGAVRRVSKWIIQLLIAIDQVAYVLLAGPYYLIVGGSCPSADETISSRVGRAAMAGSWWGKPCAWAIDHLFMLLGSKPGHCARAIETAFLGMAPK
ncbi:hypothetical protein [Sphingomonas sp. TREG-RG-20F-R18-01]|uniref:hypothetical protein n=1 Tax=Sphingomonas sp. TREG-RG-20F-R18-01 TaxID=2914982 RepID=UPI001F56E0D5|nr:hypothetical protein [Sphingomonas sp. TREG-RG-20F-R18-01]